MIEGKRSLACGIRVWIYMCISDSPKAQVARLLHAQPFFHKEN